MNKFREIDVAKNLRIIEWLKTELIDGVAVLFRSLLKTGSDATSDALASIIMVSYILGKRVGISFYNIDAKIKLKLAKQIKDTHELEEWYGDLSDLLKYIEDKKR
ncbi:MAG TPA: MazG-like family protein [Syntrophomonadaceae bacterium]|nr:MazG-like family protein [Syntrophomonadaceae bacterium]